MLSWFRRSIKPISDIEHTEIPDMSIFSYRHVIDLAFDSSLPSEFEAIAVGWLGDAVSSSALIEASMYEKLSYACQNRQLDSGLLGYHRCRICNSYDNRGEFLVEFEDRRYVLPRMILHYITEHQYSPPLEFITDLEAVTF